jgi:magnesium-transporting ATPase (P-type)
METLLDKHWHNIPPEQIAKFLDTSVDKGLDRFETEKRLTHFGENIISGKKEKTSFQRFLLQFHQPLVYILLVAGAVTLLLGEWVDAGVILGVVIVNAVVGFLQESKAVKALNALAASMSVEAVVLRSGTTQRVPASQLVPGDIVILRSGDKTPADLRIVSSKELRVDESTLTGESVPIEKNPAPIQREAVLAERKSMAYAGTLVSYGQGKGVVVATGNKTEVGRISGMIASAQDLETPLTRKISRFSHILLVAIVVLAATTFAFGLLRNEPPAEMFMAAVALAVGAIPEGLPAAVTIILALGVSRMAKKRAIIRKLPAVETLGGTTVICSDKTGTLTENQMTVQHLYSGGYQYEGTGIGYSAEGEIRAANNDTPAPSANKALHQTLLSGLLCNDAQIRKKEGQLVVEGDPTEAAMLISSQKFGLDRTGENKALPRIDELPFESELQYMATLHANEKRQVAYMKGGVEKILERCTKSMGTDGSPVPLNEKDVKEIVRHQYDMAAKGLRVLAFASKEMSKTTGFSHEDVAGDMVFLGLQGMIDPPREEARQAVETLRRAGVAVKMITGDHAVTAQAIGRQLGLAGKGCEAGDECPVITGQQIAQLNDAELAETVNDMAIFARVSPEQKLRLVMALQAQGEVSAMTGDGVNDAPALKQADIGIAMGVNGTEAAKEASDMVLTDDNFATIENAVEEGRCVYDNLVKFIAWTLPTNAGEGLVILTAILFGVSLPILPVQILWINMTTAACLGMMLAFEPQEPGIMNRAPRLPSQPILEKRIFKRIALVSVLLLISAFGLFEWESAGGATQEKARTMAVNTFVIVEAFYLLNSRSFTRSPFALGLGSNLWVLGGIGIMVVLQLIYTHAPFMNTLFSSAPIDLFDWIKIFSCGVLVFCIVELEKKRTSKN